MSFNDLDRERLIRYLDGVATESERLEVAELLRTNAAAREFLRAVAEHSVMVADLERSEASTTTRATGELPRPHRRRPTAAWVSDTGWRWAAAFVVLLTIAAAASQWIQRRPHTIGKILWVTGSSQLFASRGQLENTLPPGMNLSAGDTLETRSCDSLVALELPDRSSLFLAGKSTLRVLDEKAEGARFELVTGQLWFSPPSDHPAQPLSIQTPGVHIRTDTARFYLQAGATDTSLRVSLGAVRLRQHVDGTEVNISAGHQITTSLNHPKPLQATPRPLSTTTWACDLDGRPQTVLGRWLPVDGAGTARLTAVPMLWPIPNRKCILLHLAGVSALANSEQPLLLTSDSRLVIRGRTQVAHSIRFGFASQDPQGHFTGKFEVDVPPELLVRAGDDWTATLPVDQFRPLQPELAPSPVGLELTDIYALTIQTDAGLELHRIELTSGKPPTKL